ncbi:MAG TPA: DUF2339 domain-containing protein [Cyclobacteriaceae bacterium]|nr:DUF2339 domain-containing protein [Cyclobacteriaceae bacterium]
MAETPARLEQLLNRLDALSKRHEVFKKEIEDIRREIDRLRESPARQAEPEKITGTASPLESPKPLLSPPSTEAPVTSTPDFFKKLKARSDFEKFIGENLINKIGIAITVIGVGIGTKYAIDHELISPLTRIILGYLFGAGLLGFAIRLKKNYENFSAVLLSGAIAILYFITFAAYSFYSLVPQALAFVLMVVFTAFGVIAAINYNRQVIAHIGLVGAYAVPFLLSTDSGKAEILFSYMAIINVGILIIAFRRYWKTLFYNAFLLSWFIFLLWYFEDFDVAKHLGLSLSFATSFFLIFYVTFLAYKLINNEKFSIQDIIFLLLNSFIFYSLGYAILDEHPTGEKLLGLFTLANAVLHFSVSLAVYRKKLADSNLFYFITGLVLVFITIAFPVQLNGRWVTLLWAGEAVLLFRIGTSKGILFYRKLSYPLMLLAFFSIIHDWVSVYGDYAFTQEETTITPVFNIHLLTSVLVIASFLYINLYHIRKPDLPSIFKDRFLVHLVGFSVPAILLVTAYYSFRVEIDHYWQQAFHLSSLEIRNPGEEAADYYQDYDLLQFKTVWIIGYTMLFFVTIAWVNLKKIRNKILGYVILGLSAYTLAVFLIEGLPALGHLRDSYLNLELSEYYVRGPMHIVVRYFSIAFAAILLFTMNRCTSQDFIHKDLKVVFELFLHINIVALASSELIHWLEMARITQSDKLGLSILWGVYSLFMIVLGIMKHKKFLRIGAIVLFGITLLKLFFYDISHLNTISKTIIFISLGILLLVISFLYNKYRLLIAENNEK